MKYIDTIQSLVTKYKACLRTIIIFSAVISYVFLISANSKLSLSDITNRAAFQPIITTLIFMFLFFRWNIITLFIGKSTISQYMITVITTLLTSLMTTIVTILSADPNFCSPEHWVDISHATLPILYGITFIYIITIIRYG